MVYSGIQAHHGGVVNVLPLVKGGLLTKREVIKYRNSSMDLRMA